MKIVHIDGWKVGFQKIEFTKMLQRELGQTLTAAKNVTDSILERQRVQLVIEDEKLGRVSKLATELGAIVFSEQPEGTQSINNLSYLDCLERIQPDCVSYRQSVDRLFGPLSETDPCWRIRYLDILVAATRLYLDYLLVTQRLPEFEAVAVKKRKTMLSERNTDREQILRKKLTQEIKNPSRWISFEPRNPFSTETGLMDIQTYLDKLTLHLPEIYEETFHVEIYAISFLANQNSTALAYLSVGMDHLGRNHISFVLQALQWLANEGSWN